MTSRDFWLATTGLVQSPWHNRFSMALICQLSTNYPGVSGFQHAVDDVRHQRQELLLVVAARMADDQTHRPRFRGDRRGLRRRRGARKSCCCRRRSWFIASPVSEPRSGTRLPSLSSSTKSRPRSDCCRPTACAAPIAARSVARFIRASPRCAPRGRRTSRGISLTSRLGRRLGATLPALRSLARMLRRVRPISVWRDIDSRCDVCTGRDVLSRRASPPRSRRPIWCWSPQAEPACSPFSPRLLEPRSLSTNLPRPAPACCSISFRASP